jgi:hypothetical protein
MVGRDGPLGEGRVAVQITNLFLVKKRTSNWMFLLCAWNIMHLFYNGASLYCRNQVPIHKKAMEDCNAKKHVYDSMSILQDLNYQCG